MKTRSVLAVTAVCVVMLAGCAPSDSDETTGQAHAALYASAAPEYFKLRPELEDMYGYTHAVRIGPALKISGAVSMDAEGNPLGVGDMEAQVKNVYADLDRILKHHGYTFDDVIVENVFTTDMAKFLEVSGYRATLYTQQFPTGSWLEVKGLALPEFMIEIEVEAHKGS